MSSSTPIPAAASLAVADVLGGPAQPATVLGVFPTAVYLAAAERVVAIVSREGVRLPNALVLNAAAMVDLQPVTRAAAFLGHGRLRLGADEIRAGRWWDPLPRLGRTSPAALASAVERLASRIPARAEPARARLDAACDRLAAALERQDPTSAEAAAAATALVGLGPGLTPAGDDVLAGVLAALVLLPRTVGAPPHPRTAALAAVALHGARGRTPALSAALLGHAANGQVAEPAARLLRALVGGSDLADAAAALVTVGHTSGRELGHGIALGARAVVRDALAATAGKERAG